MRRTKILWQIAVEMKMEMENVKLAFKIIQNGEKAPNGYQYVSCHMVFDIKMDEFHRKACLVVGGHMMEAI